MLIGTVLEVSSLAIGTSYAAGRAIIVEVEENCLMQQVCDVIRLWHLSVSLVSPDRLVLRLGTSWMRYVANQCLTHLITR